MELKKYQKQVLEDLQKFLDYLNKYHNYARAYTQLWADKGISVGGHSKLAAYKNTLANVPHVCFKVPTGGGKTFLACASVKPIFDAITTDGVKAVVWLVPSDAILSQTVKNLKDSTHPYRQRLDRDFAGKVCVYTKDEALNGQNLNPIATRDQLSVFVLSYDSFRANKKEWRKAFQQNGALMSFKNDTVYPGYRIAYRSEEDKPSLADVISSLEPIVIVDESHHAQTELSIDMLKNFNPVFVLDLTATPKSNSNIISVVEAYKLKKENMVKLPVIVSNQNNQEEVLMAARNLQYFLEKKAAEEESHGAPYIRPIVLLQAESHTNNNSTTYAKIKEKLIKLGIPEEQIAIKTADINELKVKGKDVDLLSRSCEIRYIITVNALKEGWDCPFAYILATIANRSSVVDVEQIVGRILRLPYARNYNQVYLNMSYVFTCSSDFRHTLDNVVKGLNNAGFSEKDYRAASFESVCVDKNTSTNVMHNLFGNGYDECTDMGTTTTNDALENNAADTDDFSEFMQLDDSKQLLAVSNNENNVNTSVEYRTIEDMRQFLSSVAEQQESYNVQLNDASNVNLDAPQEYIDDKDTVYVQERFASQLDKEALLPKFYYQIENSENSIFGDLDNRPRKIEVNKTHLAKNFNLSQQNIEIDFSVQNIEIYRIDINDGEEIPKRLKMSIKDAELFREALALLPEKAQKRQLKNKMVSELSNRYDSINHAEITEYVDRIIESCDNERLNDMRDNYPVYVEKIKNKIDSLLEDYYEKHFMDLLTSQEIFVEFTFAYKPKAIVKDNDNRLAKSLYTAEGKMNGFEQQVIEEISALDNVLWWHRNSAIVGDANAYYINGFINHYPDFIVMTKKGHVIAIETKGEHLENPKELAKARLGKALDDNDNNRNFSYFMVFKNDIQEDGCCSLKYLLNVISKW